MKRWRGVDSAASRYCMSFDLELVEAVAAELAPHCTMLEAVGASGDGPAMHGVFACRRVR